MVVQVKKNQPNLWDAVQSQFQAVLDAGKEQVITEIRQEAHGRREERYVFQLKPKFTPEMAERWPTIRSIIAVERHRTQNGKGTVDTSYYVSSLSPAINPSGITFVSIGELKIASTLFLMSFLKKMIPGLF
ncbi:protein of unknown function [Xenorhabdus nematophila AN6/1]|nr:protein of unknown function [Xenorhabdus nematophila AN6/1]